MTEETNRTGDMSSNIWITSKTRMYSEIRFTRYRNVSHLLLSYYSIVIIAISVFSDVLAGRIEYLSQINIMIATILLTTSLIIYGFKFDETARSHRDCYLQLQELLSSNLTGDEKLERYNQILFGYPNHAEQDYDRLIIDRTFLKHKEMSDSKGPVKYTKLMLLSWVGQSLFFWGFIILLVLLPAYLLVFPLYGAGS